MKKVIYLMAAFAVLALSTACNERKYVGSQVDIALQVYQDGELVFEDKDVSWNFEQQPDGTFTLFMNKTRFVEAMPMLDMEVRGLVNRSTTADIMFKYETEQTIPYYAGTEFPRYVMTDFSCIIYMSRNAVIRFTCTGYNVIYTETWTDIYE